MPHQRSLFVHDARRSAGASRWRCHTHCRGSVAMRDSRRIRADVNAILTRLAGESVITAFGTKQDSTSAMVRRLRIFVVPGSATDPNAAKRAVLAALDAFSDLVT